MVAICSAETSILNKSHTASHSRRRHCSKEARVQKFQIHKPVKASKARAKTLFTSLSSAEFEEGVFRLSCSMFTIRRKPRCPRCPRCDVRLSTWHAHDKCRNTTRDLCSKQRHCLSSNGLADSSSPSFHHIIVRSTCLADCIQLSSKHQEKCRKEVYKLFFATQLHGSLCDLVARVPVYTSRGPGFVSKSYQIFWEVVGLKRGNQPREDNRGALEK
jgi:hypothetical protein